MATNIPTAPTYIHNGPINFREIPTITLRYSSSEDERVVPFAPSPLDEYRGAGSLSLRRIRSLGASDAGATPSDYAADRARSILREARDAIQRILGESHPLTYELHRLVGTL
jgi:hypothetical protein